MTTHKVSLSTIMNIVTGKRTFLVFRSDDVPGIKVSDYLHLVRDVADEHETPMDMYIPVVFIDKDSLPESGLNNMLIVGIRQPGMVYNEVRVKIYVRDQDREEWIDGKLKSYSDLIRYYDGRDFGIINVDVIVDDRVVEYQTDKSNVSFDYIKSGAICP